MSPKLTRAAALRTSHRKTRFHSSARYGASATIRSVAKMIVPSIISGHSHDGHPGHADIAANSRSDVNDSTKLTVAIPTVNHTAARRLLRTRCSVRISSSAPSHDGRGGADPFGHQRCGDNQPRRDSDAALLTVAPTGPLPIPRQDDALR